MTTHEPQLDGRTVCTNCRRPYSTRECANDDHRRFHGFAPNGDQLPPGRLHCGRCDRILPARHFFQKFRSWNNVGQAGLHAPIDGGRWYKTCNQCRFQRKTTSPRAMNRKGLARKDRFDTDQFWKAQALK